MPRYEFDVDVVYQGTVWIEAPNESEAESIFRQAVKPQGVVYPSLVGENDDWDFDPHPTVHFKHMKEIP